MLSATWSVRFFCTSTGPCGRAAEWNTRTVRAGERLQRQEPLTVQAEMYLWTNHFSGTALVILHHGISVLSITLPFRRKVTARSAYWVSPKIACVTTTLRYFLEPRWSLDASHSRLGVYSQRSRVDIFSRTTTSTRTTLVITQHSDNSGTSRCAHSVHLASVPTPFQLHSLYHACQRLITHALSDALECNYLVSQDDHGFRCLILIAILTPLGNSRIHFRGPSNHRLCRRACCRFRKKVSKESA